MTYLGLSDSAVEFNSSLNEILQRGGDQCVIGLSEAAAHVSDYTAPNELRKPWKEQPLAKLKYYTGIIM
jgi:hypothetical protein